MIAVSTDEVRAKCRVGDGSLDSRISALVAELRPVVEFAIRPEVVASNDPGLTATLTLAMTEIVSAELLEERLREPTTIEPTSADAGALALRVADRLRHRGWARLKPYLKSAPRVFAA